LLSGLMIVAGLVAIGVPLVAGVAVASTRGVGARTDVDLSSRFWRSGQPPQWRHAAPTHDRHTRSDNRAGRRRDHRNKDAQEVTTIAP
jgi:hypothetical protein